MKILHISTFQNGGASIAAIRLHQALLAHGHESKFLFFECKESNHFFKYKRRNHVINFLLKVVNKLDIPLSREEYKIRKYKKKFEMFSFATTPYIELHKHFLVKESDIINLHWIANFVDYTSFFRNVDKPIVWTLHDMQPFLGGFHYEGDEIRNAITLNDFNNKQYTIKKQSLVQMGAQSMTIIAPSKWLLNLSMHSEILKKFPHKHIPYSVNRDIFKLLDKKESKGLLGFSEEKTIVLFVAEKLNNYRKGFDMVLKLVKDKDIKSRCVFITVGKVKKAQRLPGINYLGTIKDEKNMSLIYNAADLFILPSREDNLPNTMIESLCCGTPVVGFNIGGLKESIVNYENGVLANNVSVSELKDALITCLDFNNLFDRVKISLTAQVKYSTELQVTAYLDIYKEYMYK